MVKADWIKPGAIVIDVGINRSRFHPNQAPPAGFENKFVFNWQVRAGRYFPRLSPSCAVSHTRRLGDL
jgi:hypothetical protein